MSVLIPAARTKASESLAGKVLLAASAVAAVMSVTSLAQSYWAQGEIKYRKRQLQKPVYKLSKNEMVNPPWNRKNLKEWLYRRGNYSTMSSHRLW